MDVKNDKKVESIGYCNLLKVPEMKKKEKSRLISCIKDYPLDLVIRLPFVIFKTVMWGMMRKERMWMDYTVNGDKEVETTSVEINSMKNRLADFEYLNLQYINVFASIVRKFYKLYYQRVKLMYYNPTTTKNYSYT